MLWLFLAAIIVASTSDDQIGPLCGGLLTARRGIIQTPNFPNRFPVPIKCRWIIDASSTSPDDSGSVSIVVYLTQLFVTTGLKFTEYTYYEPDSPFQLNPKLIYEVTDDNAITTKWVMARSQFFVLDFEMNELEGNHLRVLDNMLNVYGFNITYEAILSGTKSTPAIRNDSCSVLHCSLAGHCYISHDFRTFFCWCFAGFFGSECMRGPLCQENFCKNGGTCRHVGIYAMCHCPSGFSGPRCDVPLLNSACEENCLNQCKHEPPVQCKCESKLTPDMWRYELGIRLSNISALSIQHPGHTLASFLVKQISRQFQSFGLSRLDNLQILTINENGRVIFQFFGSEQDRIRIRAKLVEKGRNGTRFGEMTLFPSEHLFLGEPVPQLKGLEATRQTVREGEDVTLACVVKGNSQVTFHWMKDGYSIQVNQSNGGLRVKILPTSEQDEFTAVLGIERVTSMEEGLYTCLISYWGMQDCKSTYVEVIPTPRIALEPMSVSIQKGDDVILKCMLSNKRWTPHYQQIGYSWTRDKTLFPLNPGKEVWEDLKPTGTILRLKNVQRSTTYTCMAHSTAANLEQSVRIDVINLTAMAMCKREDYLSVKWSVTAPGSASLTKCPTSYSGIVRRQCLSEPGKIYWNEPDFSKCISDVLQDMIGTFRLTSRGFTQYSVKSTMEQIVHWLKSRTHLYPGETEPLVELLQDILVFTNRTSAWSDFTNCTINFYNAVNYILDHPQSLINEVKLRDLQVLINRWSLLWSEKFRPPSSHFPYDNLLVDIIRAENSTLASYYLPNLSITYPQWYDLKVAVHVTNDAAGVNRNNNYIVVVNFRNLSSYLPQRSTQKMLSGSEVTYEMQSSLVSISVTNHLKVHVDIEIPLKSPRTDDWNLTCAVAPSLDSTWDFSTCNRVSKQFNVTHCECQWPGVYSAMLTRMSSNHQWNQRNQKPSIVVLIMCNWCFVQSFLAFILLLKKWLARKTTVVFLKMKFCASVAGSMCIFIYASYVPPSKDAFLALNVLMEIFIFFGLTSQLSKLLVIYTEVVPLPNVKNVKKTVFCITTGVTLLEVLTSILAHHLTGEELKTWWLPYGSAIFFTAVSCEILVVGMFFFLAINLFNRLKLLLVVHCDKTSHVLQRRVKLLKRCVVLFICLVAFSVFSIAHVNSPSDRNYYIFSALCSLLGTSIFLWYIILSESSISSKVLVNFKLKDPADVDHSTSSDYNLFSLFHKQEPEVESESSPPDAASSTQIELKQLDLEIIDSTDPTTTQKWHEVDLEIYPSSPRKYAADPFASPPDSTTHPLPDVLTALTDDGYVEMNCSGTFKRSSDVLPTIVEADDAEEKDVMDMITNDLNYLLNSKTEVDDLNCREGDKI